MMRKFFRRFACKAFGHEYRTHQAFTPTSRRVVCDRCGGDWGMNDNVQAIIPWSDELEEMYRICGYTIRQVRSQKP